MILKRKQYHKEGITALCLLHSKAMVTPYLSHQKSWMNYVKQGFTKNELSL
jgi:hypothetical protein